MWFTRHFHQPNSRRKPPDDDEDHISCSRSCPRSRGNVQPRAQGTPLPRCTIPCPVSFSPCLPLPCVHLSRSALAVSLWLPLPGGPLLCRASSACLFCTCACLCTPACRCLCFCFNKHFPLLVSASLVLLSAATPCRGPSISWSCRNRPASPPCSPTHRSLIAKSLAVPLLCQSI